MLSSNFLAANSKATHAPYIRVVKAMIKNEGVMTRFERIAMDMLVVMTLKIAHLAHKDLYSSTEEETLLMI